LKHLIALAPLLLLAACGSSTPPKVEIPNLPAANVDQATVGIISGSVFFQGEVPPMPVIDMSSNPQCERQHKTPQKAQTVVVNANKTLRYTFLYISKGLPRVKWAVPTQAATLDQNGCIYAPHLVGLMQGQQLEILNSDPVNHNVHSESKVNAAWNESQPPRAEHKFKQFDSEEILFPVTCSVHPWMRAYIGVSPNPFFAVTGEDGTFSLKGVPPGTYTVEAVHEKYGRKQGTVTVTAHGEAKVDFTYGN